MDPQNPIQPEQYDPDLPDDDDLTLFHKSSLKDKQQLPLVPHLPQHYNTKRTFDPPYYKTKDYTQLHKLGEGTFAQVKKVTKQNKEYAMKIYNLQKLKSNKFYAADGSFADSEEMFRNQVQIIKCIQHSNLVKCQEILYGGNYAYLVMELCGVGQIMLWDSAKNNYVRNTKVVDYLRNKYHITSLPSLTQLIFLQVALGIQYLHNLNISNRDIKVDNILCKSTQQSGNDIKIADFTTIRYSQDDISYFCCGTVGFRAPQMQNCTSQGYSCKAHDIWGIGISLYTFYYQTFPFMGETQYQVEMRADKEELRFQGDCPNWIRNVVEKMTKKNGAERIDINQVVELLSKGDNA